MYCNVKNRTGPDLESRQGGEKQSSESYWYFNLFCKFSDSHTMVCTHQVFDFLNLRVISWGWEPSWSRVIFHRLTTTFESGWPKAPSSKLASNVKMFAWKFSPLPRGISRYIFALVNLHSPIIGTNTQIICTWIPMTGELNKMFGYFFNMPRIYNSLIKYKKKQKLYQILILLPHNYFIWESFNFVLTGIHLILNFITALNYVQTSRGQIRNFWTMS